MKLLFLTLLFICAYSRSSDYLNEFSGDVDIYDMGTMGRGKNACSWHRSLQRKKEIFYYLAMQPWRHLVWTEYDTKDKTWYKSYINEDASATPTNGAKLTISSSQDYCRKEYAHPMPTYDIDWTNINGETILEAVDINGITCYKYPAQVPLAHIYLREQFLKESDMNGATVCRFDYIGGKSITFRSFSEFSTAFVSNDAVTGYLQNKTKCIIDPTENNVDTDLAIVLGISDSNAVQHINDKLSQLKELRTVKQIKIYYLSGESIKSEVVTDSTWASLSKKQITPGSVDAVINKAKNDLIKRLNSKAIYRGTIIALMDKKLSLSFDAETQFDRNQITVHTVVYNPRGDLQLKQRAISLLSVGDHYHEFTTSSQASTVIKELFIGIRVNLTERCNRTSCNGFCDGRDRCTCPMCCENTCNFTYCDTKTATCKPWPEGKPKAKIVCKEDCVGKQECKDFEGCVYTEYNPDCEPSAKCMKPYCDDDNKCQEKSTCEADERPSLNNMCWNYKCDTTTGNCKRSDHGNECPKLPSLCHEYYCTESLECKYREKECAKTAPYVEMECYMARCNPKTGMCENALNCSNSLGLYSGCGKTADESLCKCDSTNGFKCSCGTRTDGFCSPTQICDSTSEVNDPKCRESVCGQDLYIDGCSIKTCNEQTNEIEWLDYDCSSKVVIKPDEKDKENVEAYCMGKYAIFCKPDQNNRASCYAGLIPGISKEGGCGICDIIKQEEKENNKDVYIVTYTEDCSYLVPKCPNGDIIENANKYFKNAQISYCKENKKGDEVISHECAFNDVVNPIDLCIECFESTVSCYKATEYRSYNFVPESGECDYNIIKTAPQCSQCNEDKDGFDKTCEGLSIPKQYTFTVGDNSKAFDYEIPKECYPGHQCIPVHEFNCMDESRPDLKVIIDALRSCSFNGEVSASYHYSSEFEMNRYLEGKAQKQQFIDVASEEAYCTWTVESGNCGYCNINPTTNELYTHDRCQDELAAYGEASKYLTVECIEEICVFKQPECKFEECYATAPLTTDSCTRIEESYTCIPKEEEIKRRFALYERPPTEEEIKCEAFTECSKLDNMTCSLNITSAPCIEAYRKYIKENYDYGCKIPVEECNYENLHCTFKPMTHPSEDTKFFQQRDKVIFDDLCYNYVCQETCDEAGKCEHHWALTEESKIELNKEPAVCETVSCNPATGKSEAKPIECLVSVEFPQIDEQKAECFECKCSYQNGEMVLSMRPNTDELLYELDACGNCKVIERKTGNQVNPKIKCILTGETNLTGAIAGASVAASVVFGLIGSMVVVSIGALQTYKLVSSAMKNVISTTLENPEFVAADNEATNVLNNE